MFTESEAGMPDPTGQRSPQLIRHGYHLFALGVKHAITRDTPSRKPRTS
jgi:hypothetical protein